MRLILKEQQKYFQSFIIPWTLMLMLHIRQSIYLVLTNVLSTSFLMFNITFDQISTTLSVYTILVNVDVLDTCGAKICSYFGIAFLLFFLKIENLRKNPYKSLQNSTLLFPNGLIFDIMNIRNNQSLEFEWIPMLAPLRFVYDRRFSWLCNVSLKFF